MKSDRVERPVAHAIDAGEVKVGGTTFARLQRPISAVCSGVAAAALRNVAVCSTTLLLAAFRDTGIALLHATGCDRYRPIAVSTDTYRYHTEPLDTYQRIPTDIRSGWLQSLATRAHRLHLEATGCIQALGQAFAHRRCLPPADAHHHKELR